MRTLFRLFVRLVLALLALALVLTFFLRLASDPRPTGTPGLDADGLATKLEAAVDAEAWARTGAVRWTFRGQNEHLWDRRRQLDRVRWGDVDVLVDLDTRAGVATRGGAPVTGAEADALVAKAWALWANDSFWLNPLVKLFDDGVERSVVHLPDRRDGLLVTYTQGGVTPGDAYLWEIGDDGLPSRWRMWTKILPVQGLATSWSGWQTLATGAKVATEHHIAGPLTLRLTDVAGAMDLDTLAPGPDPFAALVASP